MRYFLLTALLFLPPLTAAELENFSLHLAMNFEGDLADISDGSDGEADAEIARVLGGHPDAVAALPELLEICYLGGTVCNKVGEILENNIVSCDLLTSAIKELRTVYRPEGNDEVDRLCAFSAACVALEKNPDQDLSKQVITDKLDEKDTAWSGCCQDLQHILITNRHPDLARRVVDRLRTIYRKDGGWMEQELRWEALLVVGSIIAAYPELHALSEAVITELSEPWTAVLDYRYREAIDGTIEKLRSIKSGK